jgi:hypothetical protein
MTYNKAEEPESGKLQPSEILPVIGVLNTWKLWEIN